MKVVADTNVVVSALLWSGSPHQLLPLAEHRRISLYTSPALIQELAGVLGWAKFSPRLLALRISAPELVIGYVKLTHLIQPTSIARIIAEDPDDDEVLACALAARAAYLITGDPHLLRLGSYHATQIVSPRTFFAKLSEHSPTG